MPTASTGKQRRSKPSSGQSKMALGSPSDPWSESDVEAELEETSTLPQTKFFKLWFALVATLALGLLSGTVYAIYLLFVHFGVLA